MSSRITTIYNAFDSLLSATFPNRTELIDEINISNNSEQDLLNGVSFHIQDTDNTQEIFNNCGTVFNRNVSVTLTGKVYDLNTSVSDRKYNDKVLLEDQKTMVDAVYANADLNDSISSITYISDGGLVPVVSDKSDIKMIQTIFEIKYTEFV